MLSKQSPSTQNLIEEIKDNLSIPRRVTKARNSSNSESHSTQSMHALICTLFIYIITKSMRTLWLVNQLWVIVPVNPRKKRASSELLYKSNRPQVSMVYLQVNALSEWIIGISLHDFINNEREISIPGIENFEFIVSERVQVNPNNSRAMSALTFLLFKLNTLQIEIVKLWVSRSHGVMTVVYWIYTTAITPR